MGLQTLLSLAQSCKGDGIPGMRSEGRNPNPFGFSLMGMGSGSWALLGRLCLPPLAPGGGFFVGGGDEEAPVGSGAGG